MASAARGMVGGTEARALPSITDKERRKAAAGLGLRGGFGPFKGRPGSQALRTVHGHLGNAMEEGHALGGAARWGPEAFYRYSMNATARLNFREHSFKGDRHLDCMNYSCLLCQAQHEYLYDILR